MHADPPLGFQNQLVVSGLSSPISLAFLPDGRMLIIEKAGTVQQMQAGAATLGPLPYLELVDVETSGERGLFGIVVDPDFDLNGYIYLYYTNSATARNRLSRFTEIAGTADPSSEFVVWEDKQTWSGIGHIGGGIGFGPDGRIYLTTGEENMGSQAQDVTSSGGKILRVNRDGTIPADNPFIDGAGPNEDAIWAMGLRNPFKASWDLSTERFFVGDVGQDQWEEIHMGALGANFGWPNCEGVCSSPQYSDPIETWSHVVNSVDVGGSAIGGVVYRGSQFPGQYQGAYFYGDFVHGWIRYLTFDAAGAVTGRFEFDPNAGSTELVFVGEGPDGSLYLIHYFSGTVRRIQFQSGNFAPLISVAESSITSGPPPISVSFHGEATDPDGDALTYRWVFGDGTSALGQDVVHTYTVRGSYTVQLEVSDALQTTISKTIEIGIGSPPRVEITSPIDGSPFRADEAIPYRAIATDLDEVLGPENFSWTILLVHENHEHPEVGPLSGTAGGTFLSPSTGHSFADEVGFRFVVTVTDSDGLSTTESVLILPQKVLITLTTDPIGLELVVDEISRTSPVSFESIVGFRHIFNAASRLCSDQQYDFSSWSNGGTSEHFFTVPNIDTALQANYSAVGPCTIRITENLQALYTFTEGSGNLVSDISGASPPLNLTIQDVSTATWLPAGGLSLNSSSVISTSGPATRLNAAISASDELSLEAWIKASDLNQSGPARIIALSQGATTPANVMLGQGRYGTFPTDSIDMRLWSTTFPPDLQSFAGSLTLNLTHVMYTRDVAGNAVIYFNGAAGTVGAMPGDLSNWNDFYPLVLGNEVTGDRPWLGEMHLVAIYDRALSADEVAQNHAAGLPPIARFSTTPLQGPAPLNVNFDAVASIDRSGGGLAYQWSFGDSTTDIGQLTSHVYNFFGMYPATLTIFDANNNVDSTTVFIQIDSPPEIISQPRDETNTEGEVAAFSLAALGTTPLNYRWQTWVAPAWVDLVDATLDSYSTPAVALSDDGAMYRCIVSNSLGQVVSAAATLTVEESAARITDGMVAYYTFLERSGTTIRDQSALGPLLDLEIQNPAATTWLPGGGLAVNSSTVIASTGPAGKVSAAIKASGELSLEAWITSYDLSQEGPARIIVLSSGATSLASTMLGQGRWGSHPSNVIDVRLSTTTNPGEITTNAGSLGAALTHVMYTRDATGQAIVYINAQTSALSTMDGSLSTWNNSFPLSLANEVSGDRPWLGELHLVTIYDRALTAKEVETNFRRGLERTVNDPPLARLVVSPLMGLSPLTVDFDGSTSFDPDGTIVSHQWDFGNSTGDNGAIVSHVYSSYGIYTAVLTVVDDLGFSSSASVDIVVNSEPVILSQPQDQTVSKNTAATFSLVADGSPTLAYQWQEFITPVWIDIFGATLSTFTTPLTSVTDDGSRYRCLVTNSFNSVTSTEATLQVLDSEAPRVTANLLALYNFGEGAGTVIADSSGLSPALNLDIQDPTACDWLPDGGLAVNSAAVISSQGPATKISTAIQTSESLTIEAWIKTYDLNQDGPARMITISQNSSSIANLMMGQGQWGTRASDVIDMRLSTTLAPQSVTTDAASLGLNLTHLVYTRSSGGNVAIYIDGQVAKTGLQSGALSSWDDTLPLVLANETGGDRPWVGEFHLVAIYDAALSAVDVTRNFEAGSGHSSNERPVASFIVDAVGGVVPFTVNFDAIASFDPDGNIVDYQWDFGDGTSDTVQNPSHAYTSFGVYLVTLTVTDNGGATDSTSFVIVADAPPGIIAQPLPQTVTEGNAASFNLAADGTAPLGYQWQENSGSTWTDIPGATSTTYTTPATILADSGTLFRCAVSNSLGSVISNEAVLTVEVIVVTPRVTDGLLAYYTFQESSGTSITDQSGTSPALNLTIQDATATSWLAGGGLAVNASAVIASAGAATKLNTGVQASGEMTVEAWIRTSDLSQDGPARIITLNQSASSAPNFMLGQGRWGSQASNVITARFKTSQPNQISTNAGSLGTALSHVVFTRNASGATTIYIDSISVKTGSMAGSLVSWIDSYPLVLANELTGDRPWLGEFHLVAIYNRALSAVEVSQNFDVGPAPGS